MMNNTMHGTHKPISWYCLLLCNAHSYIAMYIPPNYTENFDEHMNTLHYLTYGNQSHNGEVVHVGGSVKHVMCKELSTY